MWPVSGPNGSAPSGVSQADGQGGSIIIERFIIPPEHAPAVLSLLQFATPFPGSHRKEAKTVEQPVTAEPAKDENAGPRTEKGSDVRRQLAKTLRLGRTVHREMLRRGGIGDRSREVLSEIADDMEHTANELDAFRRFYRKRSKEIRLAAIRRLASSGLSLVRIGEHFHVSPQHAGRLVQEAMSSQAGMPK